MSIDSDFFGYNQKEELKMTFKFERCFLIEPGVTTRHGFERNPNWKRNSKAASRVKVKGVRFIISYLTGVQNVPCSALVDTVLTSAF